MSSDHLERLRAWRAFASQNRPGCDHMADVSYGGAPVCDADVDAALDELERLRADNAVLLDGNRRLQTMNEGLRRVAIEAREAAEDWHRATIDLYSGRDESHPADCPCGAPDPAAKFAADMERLRKTDPGGAQWVEQILSERTGLPGGGDGAR